MAAGGLSAPVLHPVDANPASFHIVAAVVVADLTGDGAPDILTANKQTGTVPVLLNGRSFAPSAAFPFSVGGSLVDAAVGDLNGDGRLDAVTCDSNTGKIFVLLNSPSFRGLEGGILVPKPLKEPFPRRRHACKGV